MNNDKLRNTVKKLRHHKYSGVDEIVGIEPKNRYGKISKKFVQENTALYDDTNSQKEDEEIISSIKTLESLHAFMSEYKKCELHKSATNMVFSDGNPKSKIMLIGEAPGHDEDIKGKPFVGRSGKLLDKMLNAIELSRDKVYIANIIPWRPPNNRRPTDDEINMCLPMIKKHIEIINPSAILLLGSTATYALIKNSEGITKIRGKWVDIEINRKKYPMLPSYHPAFLLRQPAQKKFSWEDLKNLKSRVKNELGR